MHPYAQVHRITVDSPYYDQPMVHRPFAAHLGRGCSPEQAFRGFAHDQSGSDLGVHIVRMEIFDKIEDMLKLRTHSNAGNLGDSEFRDLVEYVLSL